MAKLKKPLDPNEPVNEGIVGQAGNAALGGLSAIGNLLSLPGSMVLDALTLQNPLDQLLSPFSPDNRTTGKEFLQKAGVLHPKSEGLLPTVAGMATELALDPLTYLSLGTTAGLTKGGKALKAIGGMDLLQPIAAAKFLPETAGHPSLLAKAADLVTPATPTLKKVAEKIGLKKPLTFAEQSLKKGIKPTNRPMQAIGHREAALKMSLNDVLSGIPEVGGDATVHGIRVNRDQILKNLDDYAKHSHGMSGDDFLKQHGHDPISQGASIGIPFGAQMPVSLPLNDKLARYMDVAGQYIKWGYPGRAVAFLFDSSAGNQFQGQAQDIARSIHANMPGQMSIQSEKVLGAKKKALESIDHFHNAFADSEFTSILKDDSGGSHTLFKVDNLDRSREAFDRLSRYVMETRRGATYEQAMEKGIDKLFKFSDQGARDRAVAAMTTENTIGLLSDMKRYVDQEYSDFVSAGGKVNYIGADHLDYFPRSWDIDKTDLMSHWREFAAKGVNTQSRTSEIALMPAEIIKNLATSQSLRDAPREQLAMFLLASPDVSPYLKSNKMSFATPEDELAHTAKSAMELADWIHGLPKKLIKNPEIVYGKSPLEDMSNYLENMTKLRTTQQAVYHTLLNNIVRSGDDFAGEMVPLTETLKKAGYDENVALEHMAKILGKPDSLGYLQNMAFVPRETHDAVTAIGSKLQGSQRWMGLLGLWWDKLTSVYKENLTLPFPSFSVRNLVSGQVYNTMSGHLETMEDFAKYVDKVDLARKIKANPSAYQDIVDELHIHDVYKYGYNPSDLEHFSQIGMDVIPPSPFGNFKGIVEKARENVAKKNWDFIPEGKLKNAVDKTRTAHETALELGRRASAEAEWYNRVSLFLYLKDKGFAAAEAAKEVRKLHVDYSDLTQFEKEVMRRMIPFYTFSRKMAEQTANQILERQGGVPLFSVGGSIKAIEALRNPGELVPDYVAETASIPLGEDRIGNRNYITGFGLAFEDPLSFTGKGLRGAGLEFLSRLNPMIKAPLEYSTGELFFQAGPEGGRSMSDADPLLGRTISSVLGRKEAVKLPQLVETLAANSPLSRYLSTTRQIVDPRKSLLAKASNLTTGMRISTVSPAASDAVLRENVNQMLKDAGARQFVSTYIPDSIKESMSKEELASATQLTDTLNTLARRAKARKELQKPKRSGPSA